MNIQNEGKNTIESKISESESKVMKVSKKSDEPTLI